MNMQNNSGHSEHFVSMKKHSMAVLKGKDVPVKTMKAYTGRRGIALPFLTLALDGDECLTSSPSHFTPRKHTRTLSIGTQCRSECSGEEKISCLYWD
jgi:hypothetical protein